ncbi:unnamed protein product [Calypogeia fissa]
MFNKISSRLRNRSIGSSGNNQRKDKSFAYGKMQKLGDHSLLSEGLNDPSSENYASSPWADNLEGDEEEQEQEQYPRESSFSYAETIFPLSNVSAVSAKKPQYLGTKSNDAGGDVVSVDNWSSEDQGSKQSWGPPSSVQEEDINIGPAVLKVYEDAEEDFLGDFEDYFEHLSVDNVRKEQYPKLDVQRLVYLDYASCALFSVYQVQEHMAVLLEEGPCLGLPDSIFNISNHVPDAQDRIFQLLNTDRSAYSIVFTTGFIAGFKLMGQAFPFQRNTPLLVNQDNHEAVRTLVTSATEKGAKPIIAPIGEMDLSLQATELRKILGRRVGWSGGHGGLFVFPVQSCASGVVHSLNWVAEAQQNGWQVMIDTSTYLPAGNLDLSLHKPEFVLGSIGHLLGYPSGLGFLLVRKDSFRVQTAGSDNNVKFIRSSGSSDATPGEKDCLILDEENILNTLSFSAISSGLVHLEMVGHEAIQKRVKSLAAWLLQTLVSLKHKGDPGPPLARVCGPQSMRNRGNILAFTVLDSTGVELPPDLVKRLAEKNNIIISAGHLSSPGVTLLVGKPSERVRDTSIFEGNRRQSPLVRVSLGPVSTFQDVYRFAQFLSRFRDEDYLSGEAMGFYEENP